MHHPWPQAPQDSSSPPPVVGTPWWQTPGGGQDIPIALCQEKPSRPPGLLCPPLLQPHKPPRAPQCPQEPLVTPFHHPVTPSQQLSASPAPPAHPVLVDGAVSLTSPYLAPCSPPIPRVLRVWVHWGDLGQSPRQERGHQGGMLGEELLAPSPCPAGAQGLKHNGLSRWALVSWRPRVNVGMAPKPLSPLCRGSVAASRQGSSAPRYHPPPLGIVHRLPTQCLNQPQRWCQRGPMGTG